MKTVTYLILLILSFTVSSCKQDNISLDKKIENRANSSLTVQSEPKKIINKEESSSWANYSDPGGFFAMQYPADSWQFKFDNNQGITFFYQKDDKTRYPLVTLETRKGKIFEVIDDYAKNIEFLSKDQISYGTKAGVRFTDVSNVNKTVILPINEEFTLIAKVQRAAIYEIFEKMLSSIEWKIP